MARNSIVYIGLSGFPKGLAMISKVKIISMALQLHHRNVIVINRKKTGNCLTEGEQEGIKYDTVIKRGGANFLL